MSESPTSNFADWMRRIDKRLTRVERRSGGGGAPAVHTHTDYLAVANNLSDVANKATSRSNLGIYVQSTAPATPAINDLWVEIP